MNDMNFKIFGNLLCYFVICMFNRLSGLLSVPESIKLTLIYNLHAYTYKYITEINFKTYISYKNSVGANVTLSIFINLLVYLQL